MARVKLCTKCGVRPRYDRAWCRECKVLYAQSRPCSVCRVRPAAYGNGYCRDCGRKKSKERSAAKYGVTPEEAKRLRGLPCEICNSVLQFSEKDRRGMCLDHAVSGSYLGVLCHHCNAALGHLKHDPELLRKAVEYVERTRGA